MVVPIFRPGRSADDPAVPVLGPGRPVVVPGVPAPTGTAVPVKPVRVPDSGGIALEPDQKRALLAAVGDHRLAAAAALLFLQGWRVSEVLGLAWDDVDVSEATAWIGWQLQRVNGGLVRRQTKTSASDAPLPLPGICIRALEHRRQVEARWRAVAPDWRESGRVFTSRPG